MSIDLTSRMNDLVAAIAADINATTTSHNSARAKLASDIESNTAALAALIDDAAASGSHVTWSVNEIITQINAAVSAAIGGLTPSALAALEQAQTLLAGGSLSGSAPFEVDLAAAYVAARTVKAA